MGHYELILLGLVALPVAVVLLLHANAAIMFLSLCAGYTLSQVLHSDLQNFANLFLASWHINAADMQIGLVVVPTLLAALFLARTMRGARRIVNILPALIIGLTLALLIVPILPGSTASGIMHTSVWDALARFKTLIVAGGAVMCLLFVWLERPKHHKAAFDKKHA